MSRERCVVIDIAKGICIILVVIGHFCPDYSPSWWIALNKVIYTFHMPVFMFASGYIFMYTRKPGYSYSQMLKKKVKRLLLPYLSTSAIIITIKLLTESSLNVENPVTLYSYLKIFYLPEAGYFLWFIWALWWMFVLVGICGKTVQLWTLTIVLTILHYMPFDITDLFALNATKYYAVYFMTGVMVCVYRQRLKCLIMIPNYMIYLMFISLETLYIWLIGSSFHYSCHQILSFLGIAAVMRLSYDIMHYENSHIKWLLSVSGYSYTIYLFHTTFEGFAKAATIKIFGIPATNIVFLSVAFVTIALGIICPMFLQHKVLDKYKVTRILFGLK